MFAVAGIAGFPNRMNDTHTDADSESTYECFECGTILRSDSQPINCPDCAGQMRNRETALE